MTTLHANHVDFDTWAAMSHLPVTEEFVVFLDEGMDCHPDYALLGMPAAVEQDTYESEMDSIFLKMKRDKQFAYKLFVVAAHPKVERPDVWADCLVVRNQTCNLVRQAKLVLAHTSTAIHFAILWNKPVRLINLDMMQWHEPTQAAIRHWEKWLGREGYRHDEYQRTYLQGHAVPLKELPCLAPRPYHRWTHRQWFREHQHYTLDRTSESCLSEMPRTWRLTWWHLRYRKLSKLLEGVLNRLPYWLIRVPKPMAILISGMREL